MTVEVRELRGQIREWRRGRADTRWVDAFMDAYIAVFAALMLGSMAVSVVVHLGRTSRDACTSGACHDARLLLPWTVVVLVLTATGGVSRLFGPVFSTPAEASWLLASPADRGSLLRPRFLRFLATVVIVAGLVAATVGGLAGLHGGVLVLTLITLLGALVVTGLAAIGQALGSPLARWVSWLLALVAWLLLLGLALRDAPDLVLPSLSASWWALVAALAVLAALALWRALHTLHRLPRRSLAIGGRLAPSLSGALATLDLALLYDVLLARRWNGVGAVRSMRGGPKGPAALVARDARRLLRSPQTLLVLAASVVLPYAAAAAGAGRVAVFVAAFATFLGGLGLLSGLRVFTRSSGLVRAFPFSDTVLRGSTLIVPGLLMAACGIAAGPAIHAAGVADSGRSLSIGLAAGVAGLASGVRWVTGRPPDYSRPLVSTPAGGVPTNLYGSALRGFDILILTVAPLLIWPGANGVEASIALSAITISVLISRK